MIATASLIVAGLILAGWNHWLTCRAQLLLTYAEQLYNATAQLLGEVPSKSAPRTDGSDVKPRVWWQRLVPEMVPDEPQRPTPQPRTQPMEAVVDATLHQILDAGAQPARPRGRHRG